MEEAQILAEIRDVFAEVFRNKNIEVLGSTTAADIHGWDSLTHMTLIDKIEKHFGIKFKLMDVVKLNNVGDIVASVKKKKG